MLEQAQPRGLPVDGHVEMVAAVGQDLSLHVHQPRDIVVRFNKTAITEQSQFQRLIAEAPIGSTAALEVIRGGERRTIQMPIVQAPQTQPVRRR